MGDTKIRQRVNADGWDVMDSAIDVVSLPAPWIGPGVVTYYLLDGGWVCGACCERVTVGGFAVHVRRAHG